MCHVTQSVPHLVQADSDMSTALSLVSSLSIAAAMLKHLKIPRKAMVAFLGMVVPPLCLLMLPGIIEERTLSKGTLRGAWRSVGLPLRWREQRVPKGRGLLLAEGCCWLCCALCAGHEVAEQVTNTPRWGAATPLVPRPESPICPCPCLAATTADRFYRIDRAQVSVGGEKQP